MKGWIVGLFDDEPENARSKIIAICVVLVTANILAWTWALVAFREYPILLGTALLAYTFATLSMRTTSQPLTTLNAS